MAQAATLPVAPQALKFANLRHRQYNGMVAYVSLTMSSAWHGKFLNGGGATTCCICLEIKTGRLGDCSAGIKFRQKNQKLSFQARTGTNKAFSRGNGLHDCDISAKVNQEVVLNLFPFLHLYIKHEAKMKTIILLEFPQICKFHVSRIMPG